MYTIDIVIDEIIDALGDFIAPFVDDSEIIRGQANRVAPPLGNFVELTEILSVDLSTPYQEYIDDIDPENAITNLIGRVRSDIQVDFYGDKSAEFCRCVMNAIRTGYGFDKFPENIKPLYGSDPMQHPWNTGEKQSENRWTTTISLQYNPKVSVPQQFAGSLEASLEVPVDETT